MTIINPFSTFVIRSKPSSLFLFLGSICLLVTTLGCQGNGSENRPPENTKNTTPDSEIQKLWAETRDHYRQLNFYSDQAEVVLRYRLANQSMEEAQPATFRWNRETDSWSTKFFRTLTQKTGDRFFQTILEPTTDNLDNQVLNGEAKNWQRIFQDPISKIYLNGQTDFPISKKDGPARWAPMFGPQLALLSRSPGDHSPPYLSQEVEIADGGSGKLEEIFCRIVRVKTKNGSYQFWIDPDSKLVHQIVYPLNLLDSELTGLSELTNLQLSTRIKKISISKPEIPAPNFQAKHHSVKQFVKIPEKLASPWIGKPSPPITTTTVSNRPWSLKDFHGRTVIAVFLSATNTPDQWAESMQETARTSKYGQAEFVVAGQFQQLRESYPGISVLNSANHIRELLQLPAGDQIVIWDGHGTVQYVGSIQEQNLSVDAERLLARIGQGESIALEMTNSYSKYLQQYQMDRKNSAGPKLPIGAENSQATKSQGSQVIKSTGKLAWESRTENGRDLQPVVRRGRLQWWVLSGFQTIDIFTDKGKKTESINLEIPQNLAAKKIVCSENQGKLSIFTLDPGSNGIFQLDESGKFIRKWEVDKDGQITAFQTDSNNHLWWIDGKRNIVHCVDINQPNKKLTWKVAGPSGGLQPIVVSAENPGKQQPGSLLGLVANHQGEIVGLFPGGIVRTLPASQTNPLPSSRFRPQFLPTLGKSSTPAKPEKDSDPIPFCWIKRIDQNHSVVQSSSVDRKKLELTAASKAETLNHNNTPGNSRSSGDLCRAIQCYRTINTEGRETKALVTASSVYLHQEGQKGQVGGDLWKPVVSFSGEVKSAIISESANEIIVTAIVSGSNLRQIRIEKN